MAFLVSDPVAVAPGVASASFAINVSDLVTEADDYVVVAGQCSATSGTISETSGGGSTWTVTTLYVSSGCRMFLAYTKATGASVSSPTISLSSGTGLWQAAKAHLRDADATTFNAGTITTADGGNVTSAATGALTPSSDNALVLYFAGNRSTSGVPCPLRFSSGDVIGEVLQETNDGTTFLSMVVGTVQQTTAVASSKTFYNAITARCGSIVLPIKNKASGGLARHAVANVTRVAWLGDFGIHDGVTLSLPDNATDTPTSWDGAGAINGITVSNFDMTVSAILGPEAWGKYTGLAATLNTASAWAGRKITFGAAMNFSGKMFSVETYSLTVISSQMGGEGAIIAFRDSSGYWEAFQLVRKAAWIQEKVYQIMIDVENVTPYALGGGGALNWADIVSATLFIHRAGSSATSRTIGFRNLLLAGKTTLVGGSSGRPQEITYLDKALNGWGFVGLCDKQGPSISIKADVQIGDGTFPTYFDASATMLSTDKAYDVLTQFSTNIPASKIDMVIKAASGDTIYDRASAMSCGQLQNYSFDAASHADAFYSLSGKTFVGVTPTLLAGETFIGATFSDCGPVATKGANLTNCTISDTRATGTNGAVAVDANASTLEGCTIDIAGTGATYHLSLTSAVTGIEINNPTLSGTPAIYSALASGTLTITNDGTGTALDEAHVTFIGGSTAVALIAAPQVYQTVTVSGATAGSRIQIYDTTGSTELYNGTPTFPYTWTDSVAAAADRAIRLRVSYVSGVTAKDFIEANIGTCGQTSGTAAVSYLVNQVADATYNSNAIDGPAIYATSGITFTDAATDRVNCNIGGGSVTYKTIYACFVYWNFTATGIANDFTYISAPDTANYILSGMKIRNTSATDLSVTGGYGRDATSGASVDIIDTAGSTGNIFLAPDHVVAYATGSGVTAQDITDIAAANASTLLSAAQSTPIHSHVKQINNVTLAGSGTPADPMRPA